MSDKKPCGRRVMTATWTRFAERRERLGEIELLAALAPDRSCNAACGAVAAWPAQRAQPSNFDPRRCPNFLRLLPPQPSLDRALPPGGMGAAAGQWASSHRAKHHVFSKSAALPCPHARSRTSACICRAR